MKPYMKNISTYLSQESIDKISLFSHKKKDDMVDEDVFFLNDGTCITIHSVHGGLKLPEGFLHNPNNINIEDECMVIVKFKLNESDNEYSKVRFHVNSMIDLESQWGKYRAVKNLGDIYGIISEIAMTQEQMAANSEMVMLVNKWLNIMLKDKVDIFNCPPDIGKERYEIVRSIITNTVNSMILSGMANSLYCPTTLKNEEGEPISIVSNIDIDFIKKNLKGFDDSDMLGE